MKKLQQLLRGRYRDLIGNVATRFAALVSLAIATVVVARAGGPAAVGISRSFPRANFAVTFPRNVYGR